MKDNFIHQDETIEVACVIKTICDEYEIKPEDLRILPTIDHLAANTDKLRFKKRIPIRIPIPSEIAPKGMDDPYLILSQQRSIDKVFTEFYGDNSIIGKLENGLGEFVLKHPSREVRFWAWKGGLDYYIVGSNNAYFIHKDDVFLFTSFFRRLKDRNRPKIEIPILSSEKLTEIYKNSIGFLLKGKEQHELYKKHCIPYKEYSVFCRVRAVLFL